MKSFPRLLDPRKRMSGRNGVARKQKQERGAKGHRFERIKSFPRLRDPRKRIADLAREEGTGGAVADAVCMGGADAVSVGDAVADAVADAVCVGNAVGVADAVFVGDAVANAIDTVCVGDDVADAVGVGDAVADVVAEVVGNVVDSSI